ncbi:tRNA (adenine(22)-N(1))-methyltransferase TrmK [Planococcus sp. ISL-109]|uniref:tRNA (adenine(22)-N(1))-methyltransferase n=1 Tax=Planococcus sp. ISL-109 TaxID=2819166 RepID=UPI001BE8FBC5|nr:tRNA (adenine(22)-N(1))-methyltransferase TrmK [Planococcus sp. ISL-109]MBT2582326.1 tRNA (adenine-N(1))-methyltransferase [Planococcus sp. ISL-109]
MNAQQLSQRLMKVAEYVQQGAVVADIGSDHAYLPCQLVHIGTASRAVAGEIVKGPYESAKKQVREEGLEDKITVRLAPGLEAIEPQDGITAVTIAGMGGSLIASILAEGNERLKGVARLVLQPNVHAQAIREWAVRNQWKIVAEDILKEKEKIYEIVVLEQSSEPVELDAKQLLFGPILLTRQNETFQEKWQREATQWKAIAERMEKAEETPDIRMKKEQLLEKIALMEEVFADENS